jgi:SNF2 family DNA or RNA helicase
MKRQKKDLHNYQLRMIEWIKENQKCAIWAGVGLGKTATTLTAINGLLQENNTHVHSSLINKVLIIAPLRVAKYVWPVEITKWEHLSGLTCTVIRGTATQRKKLLNSPAPIHIINKEMVQWLVGEMSDRKEWPYDCVVIDESSAFKNPRSQRFKFLKKANHRITRMIQLSGTPASNGLLDVWSQMYLLDNGDRLGRTFTVYKDIYFDSDYMGYNWTLKQGSKERIYEKIKDKCLTLKKEDYLELPPCNKNIIMLTMADDFAQRYKELEREFILVMENEAVTAQQAGVLSNKLLQFCGGAVYADGNIEDGVFLQSINASKSWITVSTEKIDALREIVDELSGDPVLVAYNYRHELTRLKEAFPRGREIVSENDINEWNKGEIPIMFVHPASAGHGLNLQHGGNNLVWFSLTWDLETYDQLNGRLDRQGQTKPVFIHHLVFRDSIEERILERLENKHLTQNDLLNAMKRDKNA